MIETPDTGWPAQPALTPRETFLQMVREDVTRLLGVAAVLEDGRRVLTPAGRDHVRRTLAGVIAHCETVRLALK